MLSMYVAECCMYAMYVATVICTAVVQFGSLMGCDYQVFVSKPKLMWLLANTRLSQCWTGHTVVQTTQLLW